MALHNAIKLEVRESRSRGGFVDTEVHLDERDIEIRITTPKTGLRAATFALSATEDGALIIRGVSGGGYLSDGLFSIVPMNGNQIQLVPDVARLPEQEE